MKRCLQSDLCGFTVPRMPSVRSGELIPARNRMIMSDVVAVVVVLAVLANACPVVAVRDDEALVFNYPRLGLRTAWADATDPTFSNERSLVDSFPGDSLASIASVVYDFAAGKVFGCGDFIVEFDALDGANPRTVAGRGLDIATENERTHSCALDAANQNIYAGTTQNRILRHAFDGSGGSEILSEVSSSGFVEQLAVDSSEGVVFTTGTQGVRAMDLDGNNLHFLVSSSAFSGEAKRIDIDTHDKVVYFIISTASGGDRMQRVSYDTDSYGTGLQQISETLPATSPFTAILLDKTRSRILFGYNSVYSVPYPPVSNGRVTTVIDAPAVGRGLRALGYMATCPGDGPEVALGGSCSVDCDCASSFCVSGSCATCNAAGKCGDGEACGDDSECQSGACVSSTCSEAPLLLSASATPVAAAAGSDITFTLVYDRDLDETQFTAEVFGGTSGVAVSFVGGSTAIITYTVRPEDADGELEFSFTFRSLAGDAASPVSSLSTVPIVDNTPPTIQFIVAERHFVAPGTDVLVSVVFNDASGAMQRTPLPIATWMGEVVASDEDVTWGSDTAVKFWYTVREEDNVGDSITFSLEVRDIAGNAAPTITEADLDQPIVIDATAPSLVTIFADAEYYGEGSDVTLTAEFADNSGQMSTSVSLTWMGEVVADSGDVTWLSDTVMTATYTVRAQDEHGTALSFTLMATDIAGNAAPEITEEDVAEQMLVDNVAPLLHFVQSDKPVYSVGETMRVVLTYTESTGMLSSSFGGPLCCAEGCAACAGGTDASCVACAPGYVRESGSTGSCVASRRLSEIAPSDEVNGGPFDTAGRRVLQGDECDDSCGGNSCTGPTNGECSACGDGYFEHGSPAPATVNGQAPVASFLSAPLELTLEYTFSSSDPDGDVVLTAQPVDAAGNAAVAEPFTVTAGAVFDNAPPVLVSATSDQSAYGVGQQAVFTFEFEDSGVGRLGRDPDVTLFGGARSPDADDGIEVVGLTLTVRYTIVDEDADGAPISFSVLVSDRVGHAIAEPIEALTDGAPLPVVDKSEASLTEAVPEDGGNHYYKAGDTITLRFRFTDAMTSDGAVTVMGNAPDDVVVTAADEVSVLYTVRETDDSGDLEFSVSLHDTAGRPAIGAPFTSLSSGSSAAVDTDVPVLLSATADAALYGPNDVATFVLQYSENDILDPNAAQTVTIAGNSATNVVVSSATELTVTHSFAENTHGGEVMIVAAATDQAGNVASLTPFKVTTGSAFFDRVGPMLLSATTDAAYYAAGHEITLTLEFAEAVSAELATDPAPSVSIIGSTADSVEVDGHTVTATALVSGASPQGAISYVATVSDALGNEVSVSRIDSVRPPEAAADPPHDPGVRPTLTPRSNLVMSYVRSSDGAVLRSDAVAHASSAATVIDSIGAAGGMGYDALNGNVWLSLPDESSLYRIAATANAPQTAEVHVPSRGTSALNRPAGVEIVGLENHRTSGRIYWVEAGDPGVSEYSIRRADLIDLLNEEVIVPFGAEGIGQHAVLHQLAVDEVGRRVFFNDVNNFQLLTCLFGGLRVEALSVTGDPRGIAFDPVSEHVFWVDVAVGSAAVRKLAWHDRTESVVFDGVANLNGALAIDVASGHIYVGRQTGIVRRSLATGADELVLTTTAGDYPLVTVTRCHHGCEGCTGSLPEECEFCNELRGWSIGASGTCEEPDSDADGVLDSNDLCFGDNDTGDIDEDGTCDDQDLDIMPIVDVEAPQPVSVSATPQLVRSGTPFQIVATFSDLTNGLIPASDATDAPTATVLGRQASSVTAAGDLTVTVEAAVDPSDEEGSVGFLIIAADRTRENRASTTAITDGVLVVDNTPPVILTCVADEDFVKSTDVVTLTLTYSDINGELDDSVTATFMGSEPAINTTVDELTVEVSYEIGESDAEGALQFSVVVSDAALNPATEVTSLTSGAVVIDHTPPVISSAVPSVTYAKEGALVTLTLQFSDASGGIEAATATVFGGTEGVSVEVDGAEVRVAYTVQPNAVEGELGPFVFSVVALDLAGNAGDAVTDLDSPLVIDRSPPLPTSAVADVDFAAAGDVVTITVVYADASGGVLSDPAPVVTALGTLVAASVNELTVTASFTVLGTDAEGPVDFSVVASDLAGNAAVEPVAQLSGGASVIVDHTPPQLVSATASVTLAMVGTEVVMTFVFADDGGPDHLQSTPPPTVVVNGGSPDSVVVAGLIVTVTYTVSESDPDGTLQFAVTVADGVGNVITSPITSLTDGSVVVDKQAQSDDQVSVSGTHFGVGATAHFTVTFGAGRAFISSPTITVLGRNPDELTTQINGLTLTFSYTFVSSDQEGNVHFTVIVDDSGGNDVTVTQAQLSSGSLWLDKSAPTLLSATSSPAWVTAGDFVTLTLTYAESAGGVGRLRSSPAPVVTFMDGNAADGVVVAGMTVTCTYEVQSGDDSGPLEFSVSVRDDLGSFANAATTVTALTAGSTTLDLDPPTYVLGVTDSPIYTVGDLVTFTWTFSDAQNAVQAIPAPDVAVFGVAPVSIAVDGLTVTAEYVVQEDDAEGTIPFSLTVKDPIGNVATTITSLTTAEAVLDKTSPSLVSAVANFDWAMQGDEVVVVFTYTDSGGSGAIQASPPPAIDFAGNAPDDISVDGLVVTATYTVRGTEPEGELQFSCVAKDDAGDNANAASEVIALTSGTVLLDLTPPTVVSVTTDQTFYAVGDTITLTFVFADVRGAVKAADPPPEAAMFGRLLPTSSVAVDGLVVTVETVLAEDHEEGEIAFQLTAQDLTGNAVTVDALTEGEAWLDKSPPTLVSAQSDLRWVRAGDVVSLVLNYAENPSQGSPGVLQSDPPPTVTFSGGNAADDVIVDGLTVFATYTIRELDADGPLEFSVVVKDDLGSNANQASPTNSLTHGFATSVDNTAPALVSCVCDDDHVKAGDTITLTLTFDDGAGQGSIQTSPMPSATVMGNAPDDVLVDELEVNVVYTIRATDTEGLLYFSVAVSDAMSSGSGNAAPAVSSLTAGTTTVDLTPPVATVVTVDRNYYSCAMTVDFELEVSDNVGVIGRRTASQVVGNPATTIAVGSGIGPLAGQVTYDFETSDAGEPEGELAFYIDIEDLAGNILRISALTEGFAVLDCTFPAVKDAWTSQAFYRQSQVVEIFVSFRTPEALLGEAPFAPSATVFSLPADVQLIQDESEQSSLVHITRLVDRSLNGPITGNFELTVFDYAENTLVVTELTQGTDAVVDTIGPQPIEISTDDVHYREGDVLFLRLVFNEPLHATVPTPFAMVMTTIVDLTVIDSQTLELNYTFSEVDPEGPVTIVVTVQDEALNPTTVTTFTTGDAYFDRSPAVTQFSISRTSEVEPVFFVDFDEEVFPIEASAVTLVADHGINPVLRTWTQVSVNGPPRSYPYDHPSRYRVELEQVEDHFIIIIADGSIVDLASNPVVGAVSHRIEFAAIHAQLLQGDEFPLTIGEGPAGGEAWYTLVLTCQPLAPVTVTTIQDSPFLVPTGALQLELEPSELVFTPEDFAEPHPVRVTAVDDVVDEAESDPMPVDVSHSSTSADEVYQLVEYVADSRAVYPADIHAAVIDDDIADVFITVESNYSEWRAAAHVPEGAVDFVVAIHLATMPLGLVEVDLLGPFESLVEVQAPGAVLSPTSGFSFTWLDWNERQFINVTSPQDVIDHGDEWIVTVPFETQSSWVTEPYMGLTAHTEIIMDDDDSVNVFASRGELTLYEGGSSKSADIWLGSRPLSTVWINAWTVGADDLDGRLDAEVIGGELLEFQPDEWDIPQTIVVRAIDNDTEEPAERLSALVWSMSSEDELYDGLPDNSTTLTVIEDELAGIQTAVEYVQVNEGPLPRREPFVLGVWLASKPTARVDVGVVFDSEQLIVTPRNLTYEPDEWDVPQTIVILAIADGIPEEALHAAFLGFETNSTDEYYDIDRFPPFEVVLSVVDAQTDLEDAPPPKVVVAFLEEQSWAMLMCLDRDSTANVDAEPLPCASTDIFDSVTVDLFRAVDAPWDEPLCHWRDARTLRITYNAMAPVQGGEQLVIRGGVIKSHVLSIESLVGEVPLVPRTPASLVVSTVLSSAGEAISVKFDKPTSRLLGDAVPAGPCSMVFAEAASGDLGTNPYCVWESPTVLTAYMGPGATVTPYVPQEPDAPNCIAGSRLTLLEEAVRPVRDSVLSTPRRCISILPPPEPRPPVAVLDVATTIGPCHDLHISGQLSTGGGGRPLAYAWSIRALNEAADEQIDTLTTIIAEANSTNSAELVFPTQNLTAGAQFELSLSVADYLGTESVVPAQRNVTVVSETLPSAFILGGPHQFVKQSGSLLLATEVRGVPAGCRTGGEGSVMEFSWNLTGVTLQENVSASVPLHEPDEALILESVSLTGRELVIPSGFAAFGHSYQFTFFARMRGSPRLASSTVTVSTVPEGLVAAIAGGDRTVGDAQPLVLDARPPFTQDLDALDGPLQYNFTCRANVTGGSVFETHFSDDALVEDVSWEALTAIGTPCRDWSNVDPEISTDEPTELRLEDFVDDFGGVLELPPGVLRGGTTAQPERYLFAVHVSTGHAGAMPPAHLRTDVATAIIRVVSGAPLKTAVAGPKLANSDGKKLLEATRWTGSELVSLNGSITAVPVLWASDGASGVAWDAWLNGGQPASSLERRRLHEHHIMQTDLFHRRLRSEHATAAKPDVLRTRPVKRGGALVRARRQAAKPRAELCASWAHMVHGRLGPCSLEDINAFAAQVDEHQLARVQRRLEATHGRALSAEILTRVAQPALFAGPLNRPAVEIQPFVLLPGTTYRFYLATPYDDGVVVASASMSVNVPPTSGSVAVTPEAGVMASTQFKLSASSWQDEELPLQYMFGYAVGVSVAGSGDERTLDEFMVSSFSRASSTLTVLPAGPRPHRNHTVVVYVRDALRASSRGTVRADGTVATVHVEQLDLPEEGRTDFVADATSGGGALDELLSEGSATKMIGVAGVIASVLDDPCSTNDCNGHGACISEAGGICACDFGYSGETCEFAEVLHGGYGEWGAWGPCSLQCGTGLRSRTRRCNSPAPARGGLGCEERGLGLPVEQQECNTLPCGADVDGGYSQWSEWSDCRDGIDCEGVFGHFRSTQTRTRSCNNPTPTPNGQPCAVLGAAVEQRQCEAVCEAGDKLCGGFGVDPGSGASFLCSGHGACVSNVVGVCKADDACTVSCLCAAGWGGQHCQLTEEQILERQAARTELVAKLGQANNVTEASPEAMAQVSGALLLAAEAADELDGNTTRAALDFASVVASGSNATGTSLEATTAAKLLLLTVAVIQNGAVQTTVGTALDDADELSSSAADVIGDVSLEMSRLALPGSAPVNVQIGDDLSVASVKDSGSLLRTVTLQSTGVDADVDAAQDVKDEVAPGAGFVLPEGVLGEEPVVARATLWDGGFNARSSASDQELSSSAVSLELVDVSDDEGGHPAPIVMHNLQQPVHLTIPVPALADETHFACRTWDEEAQEWTTRGLATGGFIVVGRRRLAICRTSHLSEFAGTEEQIWPNLNVVDPIADAGLLDRYLDLENMFPVFVLVGLMLAFLLSFGLSRIVEMSEKHQLEREARKRDMLIRYGATSGPSSNRPAYIPRGCSRRCRAFFQHVWEELLQGMRTEHTWISPWVITVDESLSMSRRQRVVVLLCEALAAMTAAAILFGKQPEGLATMLISGAMTALFVSPCCLCFSPSAAHPLLCSHVEPQMTPAEYIFPWLFSYVNEYKSFTKKRWKDVKKTELGVKTQITIEGEEGAMHHVIPWPMRVATNSECRGVRVMRAP